MNKESKYKVTVIIPTFNAEKYIKRTINSVINQTIGFENIDLIIIDDNSKDGTQNILKEFSKEYENICTIFLKENSGSPSKPRNVGIQNSITDYIMFLDQDDEYTPDICKKLYSNIVKDNLDLVISRFQFYDTKKNTIELDNPIALEKIKNISDIDSKIIPLLYRANGTVWNNIYKKSLILENNIRFPDNLLTEDFYFNLQYYVKVKKIKILKDFVGYKHYLHGINTSKTFFEEEKMLKSSYKTRIMMLNFIENEENYNRKLEDIMLMELAVMFLWHNSMTNSCMDKYWNGIKVYLKKYKIFTRIQYSNLLKNILLNIFIKIASVNKSIPKLFKKLLKIFNINLGGP